MSLSLLPVGSRTSYSSRGVLTNEETVTRASDILLPCWGVFDWLDKGGKWKQRIKQSTDFQRLFLYKKEMIL